MDFGRFEGYKEFYKSLIDRFKNIPNLEKVDGFTLEYLLREYYADTFGIVDLGNKEKPLALISYVNTDTLGDLSHMARYIAEYRNNNILELFGLSFKDYMELDCTTQELLKSRNRIEKEDSESIENTAKAKAEKELANIAKMK